MSDQRTGTRCKVCVHCGACFEDASSCDKEESNSARWSGKRCAVCVSCGECARAWGLVSDGGVDGVSGATDWASAFKAMDDGSRGAPPPLAGSPGVPSALQTSDHSGECDAVTGATPGVSSACKELGLDDMGSVLAARGIKPPGEA